MKKLLFAFIALFLFLGPIFSFEAFADVWVNGYYRSSGTYVQGHYRSNPDGNPYNNWSFPGNTNPYTGETAGGSVDAYLNNYGGSSGYSPAPSYSPPPLLLPTPTYTPTYSPSYDFSSLFDDDEEIEIKKITWIAKQWADKYSSQDCEDAPLTSKDRKLCESYRDTKYDSDVEWEIKDEISSKYPTCDGKNYYFLNACPEGSEVVCRNETGYCSEIVTEEDEKRKAELEAQVQTLLRQVELLQIQQGLR